MIKQVILFGFCAVLVHTSVVEGACRFEGCADYEAGNDLFDVIDEALGMGEFNEEDIEAIEIFADTLNNDATCEDEVCTIRMQEAGPVGLMLYSLHQRNKNGNLGTPPPPSSQTRPGNARVSPTLLPQGLQGNIVPPPEAKQGSPKPKTVPVKKRSFFRKLLRGSFWLGATAGVVEFIYEYNKANGMEYTFGEYQQELVVEVSKQVYLNWIERTSDWKEKISNAAVNEVLGIALQ